MNITRWLMAVTLLIAGAFSQSLRAQPVPAASSAPVSYPVSTVRNVSTIGAGSVASGNVGRYAFAVATGGLVVADAATGLPLPDGRNLPVAVSSQIPRANVAAAIGRAALKLSYPLSVGVALYDLGQELGFGVDNSSGTLVVQKMGTSTDMWQVNTTAGVTYQCRASTVDQVCACAGLTWGGPTNYCMPGYRVPVKIAGTSQPGAFQPSSIQALQDAIAAKSSWPTSSALARSTVDAVKAGEIISLAPQTVTGPATSPGPVTQTVDNVNNTTTTSTTTHNHTYSGPSVTTTSTTTNITIDNSTGNVISSTTSTTQPVMPETDAEEGSPIDKALPGLPQLYQPKYPDGLVGVWNDKKAQLDSAPLVALVGDLMPSVAATGACPTWVINMNLGVWDYGIFDLSPPCWLWDFARAVIIACALLLSRRLVFGG